MIKTARIMEILSKLEICSKLRCVHSKVLVVYKIPYRRKRLTFTPIAREQRYLAYKVTCLRSYEIALRKTYIFNE